MSAEPGREATAESTAPLLRVENLVKHYGTPRSGLVRALDGVSLTLKRGATLAVVGESGSGKSTLARTLLRLVPATSGAVYFRGKDLLHLAQKDMRGVRRHLQMIFQDPYASLHPTQTTAEVVSEPWKVHPGLVDRRDRAARVDELLDQVGLPRRYARLSPSRLSGGERQRIAIARALALRPEVMILDEPVSALDVSTQAQVMTLLMTLQQEFGLSYVFISHDLSLVRLVADQVAVMYRGRVVERGVTQEVYDHPAHPYTQALLASLPGMAAHGAAGGADGPAVASGETAAPAVDGVPVPEGAPAPVAEGGCRFADRCPKRQAVCDRQEPGPDGGGLTGHFAACHFADPAGRSPAR
jgi:ABC-type oligopeptide transport system ATPase subunit